MRAEAPSSRAADAEAQGRRRLVSEAAALLLRAAAPERRHVGQAVAWLLLAAGLEALGPLAGKYFIDRYLLPRDADLGRMAALLLGALAAGMVASWLRYGQLVRLAGVAMRSVQRIREGVYAHVLRLPMAFFDHAVIGQLVSRVTNDTEAVKTLYVQVLFVILDSLIILAGAMAAMLWLDWRLMLVVAALVPAVVLIVVLYQRLSAPAVTRTRELRSELNAQLAESIAGMPVLQAANATARFQGRFAALNDAHYRSRLASCAPMPGCCGPCSTSSTCCCWRWCSACSGCAPARRAERAAGRHPVRVHQLHLARGGAADPDHHAVPRSCSRRWSPPRACTRCWPRPRRRRRRTRAASRVARSRSRGSPSPTCPGGRCCTTSTCSWRPAVSTGSWVTPAAARARCWRCCCASNPAPPGAIRIDGVPLEAIAEEGFRASVGLVPQDPFLLAASARENITLGRPLGDAQVEAAARAAHAHGFISALERGYDTFLGEGGARLSTGQKQLLAIARALAGQPRILLLDEATAHIDSETEQVVQRALGELRGRVTIVAIAHRLSTVRDADRIVVLNHGRVAELGTHAQLMAIEGGIYQRLYQLQQLEDETAQ